MSRILCLSFSPLHADPRVHRQIQLLSKIHEVTAAGFSDPNVPGVAFIDVSADRKTSVHRALAAVRLLLRWFDTYYWSIGHVALARDKLHTGAYDLIIANDSDTWPLALSLRGSGRVLFDAHEYAPREFEDLWWWRVFHQRYREHMCTRYLPLADAVTTVCPGIADEYMRCFGVRPTVVLNAPPKRKTAPIAALPGRIRMIHHGVAIRSRRIETMIIAMDHLDERFSLDLMLVGHDAPYMAVLHDLAQSRPRVRFRPPVPMERITEETRDYEIGLFLLEPVNFNYLHALPNKFFEFIQARLAVAIGPSPEMARIAREFDCGIVADDYRPQSLARALNALTPEVIARLKQNAHHAANTLCWEHQSEILQGLVRQLLAKAPCAA
jgi:hypothetical protein